MPLLKRVRLLAAKIETTPGTAETLANADASFNVMNPMIQAEIPVEKREAQGSFDRLTAVAGPRSGKCTFSVDAYWDGAALPAWATTFLPACGLVESSQVFTPRSEAPGSNVKTLTMATYQNGELKKLKGAAGTVKIVLTHGKFARFEFEFTGLWEPVTDASILTPTNPTDKALRFASGTATRNSVAQKIESATVDIGNQVILREDPSTASGYCNAMITDREPVITMNPEADLVANDDPYGHWIADTESAVSLVLDGPAGGTSNGNITFAAPKSQVMSVAEAERNGLQTENLNLICNKDGANADQDISITFTDAVA